MSTLAVMNAAVSVRVCNTCGETKPLTEFAKTGGRALHGRKNQCKVCRAAVVLAKWRAAHPEAPTLAERYLVTPEIEAERRQRYLAQRRSISHRRRARMCGGDVREVTNRDLIQMALRQCSECFWCHERATLTIDHVIPIARGGRHAIGNIVMACASCNKRRRDRLPIEWRAWLRERKAA